MSETGIVYFDINDPNADWTTSRPKRAGDLVLVNGRIWQFGDPVEPSWTPTGEIVTTPASEAPKPLPETP